MVKKEETMTSKLRKQAIGIVSMLTVQYILGIMVNLFVKFPEHKYDGAAWKFAWSQPFLALHIIIGLLLFFGALSLLIRSILLKNKSWIISSGIAFIAILTAIIGGAIFVTKQAEGYSFVMAISFTAALLAYFYGIYASKS